MKHTHTIKVSTHTTNCRGTSEAQVNEYLQVFVEGNFNLFRGCMLKEMRVVFLEAEPLMTS